MSAFALQSHKRERFRDSLVAAEVLIREAKLGLATNQPPEEWAPLPWTPKALPSRHQREWGAGDVPEWLEKFHTWLNGQYPTHARYKAFHALTPGSPPLNSIRRHGLLATQISALATSDWRAAAEETAASDRLLAVAKRARNGTILDLLQQVESLSAAELAPTVGLSRSSLRHPLKVLRDAGLIEALGPLRSRRVRYRITELGQQAVIVLHAQPTVR